MFRTTISDVRAAVVSAMLAVFLGCAGSPEPVTAPTPSEANPVPAAIKRVDPPRYRPLPPGTFEPKPEERASAKPEAKGDGESSEAGEDDSERGQADDPFVEPSVADDAADENEPSD